jgi:hypothetical protein
MRHLFCSLCLLSFAWIAVGAEAQADWKRDVDFGVNGHPLTTGSYTKLPLEQQISLLKTLGLKTYRVNINPTHDEKFAQLSELISLAQRERIRILPVVIIPPKQYSDEDTAYNDAKAAVYNLAKQFDTQIDVWELGNEYDLYCVKNGTDGASPDDYDQAKYEVVRGLIKGMLAGLREASSSARSIVETTQHTPTFLDSGFLQRLIDDGVTFDITGYHYYSSDGRVPTGSDGRDSLRVLHDDFQKPIWISEFDKSSISPKLGPSSDPKEQAEALRTAMHEIARDAERYDVIAADIYELLNEPNLLSQPGVQPCQAQFGILEANGDFTDASRAVQDFLRRY